MTKFANLKKLFVFCLIGSLIVSALVAVVTVLVGEFNEITTKVFFTLFMVVVHSLISLLFIWDNQKENTFERLAFFTNVVFVLIVVSFFTSIFGIWKIIDRDMISNLYQAYFVVAFSSLHVNILSKVLNKEKFLDIVIYANYIFIALISLMLMPVIFLDNVKEIFGEMFYRILGAIAIIDGTLSILTIIFYKLYRHNHPELESVIPEGTVGQKRKGLSVWVWILIVYFTFQILALFAGKLMLLLR